MSAAHPQFTIPWWSLANHHLRLVAEPLNVPCEALEYSGNGATLWRVGKFFCVTVDHDSPPIWRHGVTLAEWDAAIARVRS